MTFSALDSALTGPLFATDAMRAVFADRARIAAMLRTEAALARAGAAAGIAPKNLPAAIERVRPEEFDLAELGAKTADSGVAAVPFVQMLQKLLPENLRDSVHKGATSQDIVDTALALQMREALNLIAADLSAIIDGLTAMARKHRRTICIGRTYGQHAAPITFGSVVATWLSGVLDVAAELPALRRRALVATLGGPVGTRASLGSRGEDIARRFAAELGLGYSAISQHVVRGPMAATGAWLATLIGALAKIARDVAFLSSTEVGEVAEPHVEGRGGSSSMPHKRNPVSSAVILSAHAVAPGLAATLFAAMAAGQQRPTGLWQAEWHALPALFGLASGPLREARRIAEGLTVDTARMRANLDLTGGMIFADAATEAIAAGAGPAIARKIVGQAIAAVRSGKAHLRDALQAAGADSAALAAAFDPRPSIDAAARMADAAVKEAKAVQRVLRKERT